eukprot:12874256-Ditylum_brightwellii.AAC.1
MVVYAHMSHVKLSSNIMEFIAPTSAVSIQSNIKFIPAHIPYDKSLPNVGKSYTGLLHEQNLYLEHYIAPPSEVERSFDPFPVLRVLDTR